MKKIENKTIVTKILLLCIILFGQISVLSAQEQNREVDLNPQNPWQNGHLYYTPTPFMPPAGTIVLGLHELSYTFPYRLQIHASILDNIGRLNVAAKYQAVDWLAFGAGLAHSFVHVGEGNHGIPREASSRFGVYAAIGLMNTDHMDINIIPHSQIGDRLSIGTDLGILIQANEIWGIIAELGTSLDMADSILYMNVDGGLRITFPTVPGLHIDLGADWSEFPVGPFEPGPVNLYFDVQYQFRPDVN